MSVFIGIDPGLSGGIGVITDWEPSDHGKITPHTRKVEAHKMPATEMDLVELLDGIIQPLDGFEPNAFAYLEKAHAYPGGTKLISCPKCRTVMKTRQAQGIASTWKFAQNYGTIRGILTALHIPFETISPMEWQSAMRCRTGGDKNISKAKAQQLFPAKFRD